MTTERQNEANRRNAALSTGPRSREGKAAVSRNATRHGVFSSAPVIPGVECRQDWEAHRAGVLHSLTPVGVLETRLAERVAMLLWRLDRVVRYESAAVAVSMAEAADPPKLDDLSALINPQSDDARWQKLSEDLRKARREKLDAEVLAALFARLRAKPDAEAIATPTAYRMLQAAHEEAAEGQDDYDELLIDSEEFLGALGVPAQDEFEDVTWTADLIRRGAAWLAQRAGYSGEELLLRTEKSAVRLSRRRAEEIESLTLQFREVDKKRRERITRKQARRMLPDDATAVRIERYETHLHRQLVQTLHELERMRASRADREVPPPVAVDVGVTVSGPTLGSPGN